MKHGSHLLSSISNHIILYYCIIVLGLVSCLYKPDNNTLMAKKWLGKEIIFPTNLTYKVFGQDTICPNMGNSPFKILTYVDSTGCTGCKMDLFQWKRLIDSCHVNELPVSFLFVVCSSDYDLFNQTLIEYNFNYPIIYDAKDKFNELNHFPPKPYQTFLLDKNNKVLVNGSPILSPKKWEQYKKLIIRKN